MKHKKLKIKPSKTSKKVEGFLERKLRDTYKGGKDFTVKHGMTGIIALLISTVVPMLEQWHSDKVDRDNQKQMEDGLSQQIKDSETRELKSIDDLKTDEKEQVKELWQALQNKKDKTEDKEYQ